MDRRFIYGSRDFTELLTKKYAASDYLGDIGRPKKPGNSDKQNRLLLVLAHIFSSMFCHPKYASSPSAARPLLVAGGFVVPLLLLFDKKLFVNFFGK